MRSSAFRLSALTVVLALLVGAPATVSGRRFRFGNGSKQPSTVVGVAMRTPDLYVLAAAAAKAGLLDDLAAEGPFTVFGPTNRAFVDLSRDLDTNLFGLLFDPELPGTLKHHVVPGRFTAADLSDGQELETLSGATLTVSVEAGGVVKVDGATVVCADKEAGNGVVHVIDSVLVATEQLPATVVDVAAGSPGFSTLVAAVAAADLAGPLSGPGPFTVFAPTDDAFTDLLAELGATPEELLARADLPDILKYHVVATTALSTDLSDGQELETLQGDVVKVTVAEDGSVKINGAAVVLPNLEAGNGVVHVIDSVLLPPEPLPATVVDVAAGNPDFSTLVAALTQPSTSQVLELLSDPAQGPFTVFAPVNDAFVALLAELGISAEELLDSPALPEILEYHVVPGQSLSTDLSDGQELVTLQGEVLAVTITDAGVFINGVQVVLPDQEADNGVVHVIGGVLTLPPGADEQ